MKTKQVSLEKLFPVEMQRRREGKCALCAEIVNMNDFTDELSKKEFAITGACQKCQDRIFVDE